MSSGVIGDKQLIVNIINKRAPTELSLRAKRGNLMGLLRPRHQVRGPRNDNLSMAFTIIPPYNASSSFMSIWMLDLMDKLNSDKDVTPEASSRPTCSSSPSSPFSSL